MTITCLPSGPLFARVGDEERRRVRLDRAGPFLTPAAADRFAARLGLHPSEIWPQWWDIEETLCLWCAQPTLDGSTCRGHCQVSLGRERAELARRSAAWWARVGRYSEQAREAA